jgi:hypothetical protein
MAQKLGGCGAVFQVTDVDGDKARQAIVSEATPHDPLEGRDIQVLGYGGSADGVLRLQLSAAPPPDWISLVQSGEFAYSSIMGGANPSVVFQGDRALLRITESTARQTFGDPKAWVETVNQAYRRQKAAENQRRESERIEREIKKAEEEKLIAETLRTIKFRY